MLAVSPADGSEGVDRGASFELEFDRLLLPYDVDRASIRVQSGARSVFLATRWEPVTRRILFAPFNERESLHPEVGYRVEVEALRDLDGNLGEPFRSTFRTGSGFTSREAPAYASFEEVGPLLRERCATSGCHAAPEAGIEPPLGLDLSSAEGIRRSAIGVLSEELPPGVESPYGALVFSGLPRIEVLDGVGRPGRSYLIYKVLGDPHIWGQRMPPPESGAPLTQDQMELLSSWIAGGAELP